MFIDNNNAIYIVNKQTNVISIWFEGNFLPNRTLAGGLNTSFSIFVTRSGDIYVDNGFSKNRTEKWSMTTNTSVLVMTVGNECYGIFVDTSNTLFCSIADAHQVVKKWLFDNTTTPAIIAGTGTNGSSSNRLSFPAGIFVDQYFKLYVADCFNNRIQMFRMGEANAITVAGSGAAGTITLYRPYGVIVDANGYLFISDYLNSRIIGSGPYGFRCLFGCSGASGSGSRMLNNPRHIAFDSYGNLFVVDQGNNRIQKFILASNSCGEYFTSSLN